MEKDRKLPELLAPAGSLTHLKAAVLAGADAVYIGGRQFGARAYAENLAGDQIREAIGYVHFHGRRLYLTVNTLMKEEELNQDLYGYLLPYYEAGLDGVIVQDHGTASFIHRTWPDMEVHASTQMTISHTAGALAAKKMGMTRIVPARELSLQEIGQIRQASGLEVEVFVHGALCFCYSGQCLLSSHYGGRSGNRGRCAQPCRLPYQLQVSPRKGKESQYSSQDRKEVPKASMEGIGSHPTDDGGGLASYLSPKDLCALKLIPRLVEAGVDSMKIEGRMKNVDYVAGVTAIYRRYLDLYARLREEGRPEDFKVEDQDIGLLMDLYSRGGFTDGYWNRHNGPSMMAIHTQKNLGRKIGQVKAKNRGRIQVRLEDEISPRDILIIPTGRNKETVLTVPDRIGQAGTAGLNVRNRTGNAGTITLNVPDAGIIRPGMPVYRRKNASLSDRIREEILEKELSYPVDLKVSIGPDRPSLVRAACQGVTLTIEGPSAGKAQKRALTEEDIIKQFQKTGGTPFKTGSLSTDLAPGSFLPLSALKSLRQETYKVLYERIAFQKSRVSKTQTGPEGLENRAADELLIPDPRNGKACPDTAFPEESSHRKVSAAVQEYGSESESTEGLAVTGHQVLNRISAGPVRIAEVYDQATLSKCLAIGFYTAVCLSADSFEPAELEQGFYRIKSAGKQAFLSLPLIMRHGADSWEQPCLSCAWDGIYVHNINEACWLSELEDFKGLRIGSASFYHWNREALKVSAGQFGLHVFQLSPEISEKENQALARFEKESGPAPELVAYGRLPLMVSAQCQKKNQGRCDHRNEILYLIDPHGRKLPVSSHCAYCYNRIWSDAPLDLTDRLTTYDPGLRLAFRFFEDSQGPEKIARKLLNLHN